MVYKIINKNALEALKELPDESVDCVITSPPYYGLRFYKGADTIWGGNPNCGHEWNSHEVKLLHENRNGIGSDTMNVKKDVNGDFKGNSYFCSKCSAWKGQLGLEPTYQMYIEHLMMVTKELKRVLKKTGTMFWNMGDSYSGSHQGSGSTHKSPNGIQDITQGYFASDTDRETPLANQNVPAKSLMMIPERFAIAMIDDGWILRNKIIWRKLNGMPSSVKDRFSNKWEYVFFFTKSKKYYFDLDSVRKPLEQSSINRIKQKNIPNQFKEGKSAEFSKQRPNMSILRILNNMHQNYELNNADKVEDLASDIPRHPKGDPTIHGQRLPPQVGQKGSLHPLGANPGDVFESKYLSDMQTETASPAGRVMRNLANGKTMTLVREAITNVNQYLKDKLKESGVSLKKLSEISGESETKIAHYFRTDESGCALPDREFWDKVKGILNLEEYDKHIKEEHKSVMLNFNPLGANPGDIQKMLFSTLLAQTLAIY